MKCPICDEDGKAIFCGKILQKYIVQYFQCKKCGAVYTEKPYWLEEAYSESIASVDTGIMVRNVDNVLLTNVVVEFFFDTKGNFLDYGGGYGIFTRMMRDLGYNWLWQDKYSDNYLARGFEYRGKEKIELITAFELFEHFEKPIEELKNLFIISDTILFSTLLYDDDFKYKRFNNWWYYAPETGQHICFYSRRTLKYIAKRFRVRYYKINNNMHLFTCKKVNTWKLRLLISKPFSGMLQQLFYRLNRGQGRAMVDMKMLKNRTMNMRRNDGK